MYLAIFIFLYFLCDSFDTYILVVRCMKQNKYAVWSAVQRLVAGVCWSKVTKVLVLMYIWYHMYVREDCYFRFFIEIFHFFSRYLVVGSRCDYFSVSTTCGATHAGRILFDTKRQRENSRRVWPFKVRVMLLLDRSRAWMILTSTQLWIACGHTTVVQ